MKTNCILCLAISIVLALTSALCSQPANDLGIGLLYSDSSLGFAGKLWLNDTRAIDLGFYNDAGYIDYLWHNFNLIRPGKQDFSINYGLGLIINYKSVKGTKSAMVSLPCLKAACGLSYLFGKNHPYEIYYNFNLNSVAVDLPGDLYSTHSMGIRYYFNSSGLFFPHAKKPDAPTFSSREEYSEDCDVAVKTIEVIPSAVYYLLQDKGVSVTNIVLKNNSAEKANFVISYKLDSGNPEGIKKITVPGNETATLDLMPSLTPENINKISTVPTPGAIYLKIEKITNTGASQIVLQDSYRTFLLPCDQFTPLLTDAKGINYDLTDTLSSWITFSDRNLSTVISKASEKGSKLKPPVKIVGFQPPEIFTKPYQDKRTLKEKDSDYLSQIKLIYNTLKDDYHITYVNQPIVYGFTQRIKFPSSTLEKSGNCIELAALFASVLESIEIDPIVVLNKKDGHASVGWKVKTGEKETYRLLETNVFGEDFDKVISKGEELADKYKLKNDFSRGIAFNDDGIYVKNSNISILDIKSIRKHIPPSPYIPNKL